LMATKNLSERDSKKVKRKTRRYLSAEEIIQIKRKYVRQVKNSD
jgi:hypothetical protein